MKYDYYKSSSTEVYFGSKTVEEQFWPLLTVLKETNKKQPENLMHLLKPGENHVKSH